MKPSTPNIERRLLCISVAVLLLAVAVSVQGQSALDGFDPNANGQIDVLVVQPDGKILIGGSFTTLSPNGGAPVTRNRIARLNVDGSVDAAFNPNANAFVSAIALQADGKILVGGSFSGVGSIGGQTRNRIARLDPVTGLADSFDPNANNNVNVIAVQTDGKVLLGGDFNGATGIGGQARNRIARVNSDGTLDVAFNPNANATVYSIVPQADGKVLVGGAFNQNIGTPTIGGQIRNRIARLDSVTGMADSFDPNADNNVLTIALQVDGKILLGGRFNNVGAQTRNNIARLDAATGMADTFNPDASDVVTKIVVQADGKILAGGNFTTFGVITQRNRIARLDPETGLADAFNPNPSDLVAAIAVQADGKILLGGPFTTFGIVGVPVTRNRIARLEMDGRVDRTLDPNILISDSGGYVVATAVQPDGKILIGGRFTNVLGVARNNIARLNTDGTLDTAFNPNANNQVNAILVEHDGSILVGGNFNSGFGTPTIGGLTRNYIARLTAGGVGDTEFEANADNFVYSIVLDANNFILVGGKFTTIRGQTHKFIAKLYSDGFPHSFNPTNTGSSSTFYVNSIALQEDGKILVGGRFFNFGGQTRNALARLDPVTSLADSFNPNPNGLVVNSIVVQADGKILVGGSFQGTNSIGGQTRNGIARLDPDTGLADAFDPNANEGVQSIAVQADGSVFVGGGFTNISGQTRNGIARLNAATGSPDSFNPNASGFVGSIALQTDGKVLVGGSFTNIGGQTRNRFARLSNDTAALQNLAVTDNAVIWTRSGSSPQLSFVHFTSSTSNVNYYTYLGRGTASGSNWILTGLSLPTSQNNYIRARGFYGGGQYNGSQSIIESVRNVFLAPSPPILNIQRASTNVVLSWVTNATGFTLESKTNLNTNVWSTVTPAPVVMGTNNVVTNSVSGTTRYFRLRQ